MRIRKRGHGPRINADPKNPSAEQDFIVYDVLSTENINDVMVAVLAAAEPFLQFQVPNAESLVPPTFNVRVYKSGVIRPEMEGGSVATATVFYKIYDAAPAPSAGGKDPSQGNSGGTGSGGTGSDQPLGPEFAFDTQGGTRHITQSLRTWHRKAADGSEAPNLRGAIGLSRERIEGCDVGTGELKWSVTLKQCRITHDYLRNLTRLTYCVNSERFCARARGECLFTGATGNYTDADGWVVTWNFLDRENDTGNGGDTSSSGAILIPAGDTATPVSIPKKEGHWYVWYSYEKGEIAGFSIEKPSAVYVEQVFYYDNEKFSVVDNEPLSLRKLFAV